MKNKHGAIIPPSQLVKPLASSQSGKAHLEKVHSEGFRAGWNAAIECAREALREPPCMIQKSKTIMFFNRNPFRRGTGQAKVFDYLQQNPGKRVKDISDEAGVSSKVVYNTLHRLKQRGLTVEHGG